VLLKLLSVFGSGMIGLWEGIPLGFALGLPPVVIGFTSACGSALATVLVTLLGDRVRRRLVRPRPAEGAAGRERMIDRVWRRYGIIGLGLLAPGLTGAPVGVAMGLLLRAPVGRMLFWALAGIVLWSAALTGAGIYGDAGIRRLISG
jgi:hypothetical protein